MRLALLIFALIAAPALARDLPPEEPSYEKPSFERPERPTRPERPRDQDEETERRVPVVAAKPKPKPCTPMVKCVTDETGARRAMFTADVQKDMYYLGRNFCKSVPEDVSEVTACCVTLDDKYQIHYNVPVSKKAHWKAKQFCTCVLELD
ncbi:hypothetical protein [Marivita sp. GX14005]|uniref:hypothetical protein n=1 Tax=Marivita sp. GX14005 TaxID=2942276 RepID=UPI0020195493|nr:hypothetical protein [Marivita sp. GX14005]MCL3882905.1 hypothetical protein [Marivita sp. GX14005]